MDILHSTGFPSTVDLRRRLPRCQRRRVEIYDHGRVRLARPRRASQPCESGSRPIRTYYLVSNKFALNKAKITVFLHTSYTYLRTRHQSSPKFELLKIVLPGRWKKMSKPWQTVVKESNTTRNVRSFTLFSVFMLYRMLAKSILSPKMTHFSLNIPR